MPPALQYGPCAVNTLGPLAGGGGTEKQRLLVRIQTAATPDEGIEAIAEKLDPDPGADHRSCPAPTAV